jgi:DNA-binding XRE family transcriptional regulator
MRKPKKLSPEWFRYVRFVRALTMREAAEVVGVSHVTWFRWERGGGVRKKYRQHVLAICRGNC